MRSIKTADILFGADEPPSCCFLAYQDLIAAGLCINAIPMPMSQKLVIDVLRNSQSDCIVFFSPYQYADFLHDMGGELLKIGKCLICCVSEFTANNTHEGYRKFHQSWGGFDFYATSHACDQRWLTSLGKRAQLFPLWVSTNLFSSANGSGTARIPRLCFVGHYVDYAEGVYAERRFVLNALKDSGMLDILDIPRHIATVPYVARAYSRYAAVLCPPANGFGHSIRCYEAAAAGALLVERQDVEPESNWFKAPEHRVAIPAGLNPKEFVDFVRSLDFKELRPVAEAARNHCLENFNPVTVWSSIFEAASTVPPPDPASVPPFKFTPHVLEAEQNSRKAKPSILARLKRRFVPPQA